MVFRLIFTITTEHVLSVNYYYWVVKTQICHTKRRVLVAKISTHIQLSIKPSPPSIKP